MPNAVRNGDKGPDVALVQERLNLHGFPCVPDGRFGSKTEALVMHFQQTKGLSKDGVVATTTWEALLQNPVALGKAPPHPLPEVLKTILSLGHKVMWEGDYHLNLFGIRNLNASVNSFDDTLGCAYTVNGLWRVNYWPGTTDPGTYWLKNPENVKGTAILVPGQYMNTWKIGLHGGKYEALTQQAGKVKVYRDSNKDAVLDKDPSTIMEGYLGINLHRSSATGESTQVDKWSAGCQVHARIDGFNEMMALAHKQVEALGIDTFTYTLMESKY